MSFIKKKGTESQTTIQGLSAVTVNERVLYKINSDWTACAPWDVGSLVFVLIWRYLTAIERGLSGVSGVMNQNQGLAMANCFKGSGDSFCSCPTSTMLLEDSGKSSQADAAYQLFITSFKFLLCARTTIEPQTPSFGTCTYMYMCSTLGHQDTR